MIEFKLSFEKKGRGHGRWLNQEGMDFAKFIQS